MVGRSNTFQALAIPLVALLPRALSVWSFEGQAGRWGNGLSDRVLRFVDEVAYVMPVGPGDFHFASVIEVRHTGVHATERTREAGSR